MYMANPYMNLPKRQFWKTGVEQSHVLSTIDLWKKKIDISHEDRIVSAGSCFAQHISHRLAKSGYNFIDAEPAPKGLPKNLHKHYGYGTYSARYGNIYTSAQLIELALEALGEIPSLDYSWENKGRFYDPLRPNVEPDGLDSHEEVIFHRKYHLERVRYLLKICDVFIFTLGLTEGWVCRRSGRTLPTAPGTIAGDYDATLYEFKNFTHTEIKSDLIKFMDLMKLLRGGECRFLFTVSPVPLTATAANEHVLVATTYSKSTLRSVVGELYHKYAEVDYYPSYEIIMSPWSRGLFYETNLRSVTPAGVDAAMRPFFLEHNLKKAQATNKVAKDNTSSTGLADDSDDEVVCEEALLEAFAK